MTYPYNFETYRAVSSPAVRTLGGTPGTWKDL
jgi:hypothetical protein